MNAERTMKQYLRALDKGKYEDIVRLFSKNAFVVSPLRGEVEARKFYRDLINNTMKSRITPLDTLVNKNRKKGAAYFRYVWTLKNRKKTVFNCVDVFDFDKNGRIKKLTIIYDTYKVRRLLPKD